MTRPVDGILELCGMAVDAMKAGKLDEAARLFELALGKMKGGDVPERYRAAAEHNLAALQMMRKEHRRAFELARGLFARVPTGTDETRREALALVGDLANAPISPPAAMRIDLLTDAIGALDWVRDAGDAEALDAALAALAEEAVLAVADDGAARDKVGSLHALAKRIAGRGAPAPATGARAAATLLAFVTLATAEIISEDPTTPMNQLVAWCDEHSVWDAQTVRYHVAHALAVAVDRFKSDACTYKTKDQVAAAVEPYATASVLYDLVEQHYGGAAAGDARLARAVARAAHALLGANALFARKADAAARMARIAALHELHVDDDKIRALWLNAPLRYVVALALTNSLDELRVETLRARDEAKRHMAKSDYKAWRAQMAESLNPTFLDKIGF